LRRIVISVTAVVVLGAAAAAVAAAPFNTYTAGFSFSPGKAGSAKKPVPTSVVQVLTATGTNGNRAAPLTHLTTRIYGLKYDNKAVKATCSFASVKAISNDKNCPKGALVATGNVHALLGPANDPSLHALNQKGTSAIIDCHPGLRVWNSGGGKLVFFFWTTTVPRSAHYCGGVATGQTPPYTGTIKNSGKNLVIDVPLPPTVSNKVLGSLWGSLVAEKITWKKLSSKSHGKTHYFVSSVGCKSGHRPWKQLFTANFTNPDDTGGPFQSFTAKGSPKCK
jgi:hypothetical protein